ncbi:hypothetical protein EJB05_31699, partial [Eragrostis curvula]
MPASLPLPHAHLPSPPPRAAARRLPPTRVCQDEIWPELPPLRVPVPVLLPTLALPTPRRDRRRCRPPPASAARAPGRDLAGVASPPRSRSSPPPRPRAQGVDCTKRRDPAGLPEPHPLCALLLPEQKQQSVGWTRSLLPRGPNPPPPSQFVDHTGSPTLAVRAPPRAGGCFRCSRRADSARVELLRHGQGAAAGSCCAYEERQRPASGAAAALRGAPPQRSGDGRLAVAQGTPHLAIRTLPSLRRAATPSWRALP